MGPEQRRQRPAVRVGELVRPLRIGQGSCLSRALSRWLTGGMIFWLISLGRVIRGERVAVVQEAPVPGRGHLPLCVAVLPLMASLDVV